MFRLRTVMGYPCIAQRALDGRRQLLVDVSTIARRDAGTGIQRVVRALWLALKALEGEDIMVRPIVGSRRSGYRVAPNDFMDNPLTGGLNALAEVAIAQGDIFLGLDLATHIVPFRARDLRRWQARGVQLVFVVYDLLPALYPHWFSNKSRRNYMRWINVVLRQADQVICIAEAVKRDLEGWIKTDLGTRARNPRMAVIRLSGDISASNPSKGLPDDAQATFAWIAAAPTILMVGTLEPRKGYDQALAAFERLWSANDVTPTRLLIVGRPGWMTQQLQHQIRRHADFGQRLIWIDNASDEYLEELYSRCCGLLFTSRAEGFGLPLIEAATHGKPSLVRDLPVFREFAPPGVTFFATADSDELAAAILRWVGKITTQPPNVAPPNLVSWRMAAIDLLAALGLSVPLGDHALLAGPP